jgi:uncharacterized membrane protein YtjA (UPF0391 family)
MSGDVGRASGSSIDEFTCRRERATCHNLSPEVRSMLYYALVFLIVGLLAGALGIAGVAAVASQIAWVLFLIGIVLLVMHVVGGQRTPTI